MIILDTNILIEIERGNPKIISTLVKLRRNHPENIAISSAVYAEFLFGFLKQKKKFPREIENFEIIDFDKQSASILSKKKYELEKKGKTIPLFDLITASCTITNKGLLITLDSHFKNIPGLNVLVL